MVSQETRDALAQASAWLRSDAEQRETRAARCCPICVEYAARRNAEVIAAADEIDAKLATA